MPNPGFEPNQVGYYRGPREEYPILSKFIGAAFVLKDPKEKDTALQSKENMRAMLTASLPQKADSLKSLQNLLKRMPALKANPKEQAQRRAMSEQARTALVEASVNLIFVNKEFDRADMNRNFRTLLLRDDSAQGMEENRRINEIMENGSPEARGELLTQRVDESLHWLQRIQNGEVTDQELIDNFEKIHTIQNLTANAEMFLHYVDDENSDIQIAVSPETREKLVLMERHSALFAMATERVRMIASANYEHLNLDSLVTVDDRSYGKLEDYLNNEDDNLPARSWGEKEVETVLTLPRSNAAVIRKVNLMEQIEQDFALEKEQATIQFVAKNNTNKSSIWDYKDRTLDNNFHHGYALVTTPSGDAGCYRVDANGKVAKAAAKELFGYMAPEMKNALDAVAQANKGFFIGSRAYSQAFKEMKQLSKAINGLGNPPDPAKLAEVRQKLQSTITACETYKGTKNPEQFKNDRERRRYEAMDDALAFCKRQQAVFELQNRAVEATKNAALNNNRASEDVEMPHVKANDLYTKISQKYSGMKTSAEAESSAIRDSDVGDAADKLREDIYKNLEDALSPSKFTVEKARNVMADMVLLELVKTSRTVEDYGAFKLIKAGALEKKLAENPDLLRQGIRDNGQIKAISEHATVESLRNFVMNDGEKTLAKLMGQRAEYSNNNQQKELDNQKENNQQKENTQKNLLG